MERVDKTDREWRESLTPEQYQVCRCAGTEPPFTGKWVSNHAEGIYFCVCCGAELFESATKFESGSGWPSFFQAIRPEAVVEREDSSHGMRRVEVLCAQCDAHLGHVFPDGPRPTGLRYCMNSVALDFRPSTEEG